MYLYINESHIMLPNNNQICSVAQLVVRLLSSLSAVSSTHWESQIYLEAIRNLIPSIFFVNSLGFLERLTRFAHKLCKWALVSNWEAFVPNGVLPAQVS